MPKWLKFVMRCSFINLASEWIIYVNLFKDDALLNPVSLHVRGQDTVYRLYMYSCMIADKIEITDKHVIMFLWILSFFLVLALSLYTSYCWNLLKQTNLTSDRTLGFGRDFLVCGFFWNSEIAHNWSRAQRIDMMRYNYGGKSKNYKLKDVRWKK